MKIKNIILAFVLNFFVLSSYAAQGEKPLSWQLNVQKSNVVITEQAIPKLNAGSIDAYQEIANDANLKSKPSSLHLRNPKGLRIAVKREIHQSIHDMNHGIWDTLADGVKIWRMQYQCHGSTEVSLSLTEFNLPEGVSVYVHNGSNNYYDGPHTSQLNKLETLTLPVVPGDTVVLEVNVQKGSDVKAIKLKVSEINCGYRDLFADNKDIQEYIQLKQGSCNIDVACISNINNLGSIRAVGLVLINGQILCSGSLLNNVNQDFTPYFLTAAHCGISNNTVAANTVVYWNFQSPVCGQLSGGNLNQNTIGASINFNRTLAATGADHTLITLSSTPPASYGLYYNGLDFFVGSVSGYSIHHPSGDEKAYSNGSVTLVELQTGPSQFGDFYQTIWSQGTTEQASSGGPFYFGNRVRGTLTGGTASCTNPSAPDIFNHTINSSAALLNALGYPNTLSQTDGTFQLSPGQTFIDVPPSNQFFDSIETLVDSGITGGCGGQFYCPDALVTRAQMAIFIIRALGESTIAYQGLFNDVFSNTLGAKEIEAFSTLGITSGCGSGNYCPSASTTRAQMAVFLLRAINGGNFTPPGAVGMFVDVPVSHPFAAWIEELARIDVTGGCGGGKFCPDATVTRDQMAAFLVRAFNL